MTRTGAGRTGPGPGLAAGRCHLAGSPGQALAGLAGLAAGPPEGQGPTGALEPPKGAGPAARPTACQARPIACRVVLLTAVLLIAGQADRPIAALAGRRAAAQPAAGRRRRLAPTGGARRILPATAT